MKMNSIVQNEIQLMGTLLINNVNFSIMNTMELYFGYVRGSS